MIHQPKRISKSTVPRLFCVCWKLPHGLQWLRSSDGDQQIAGKTSMSIVSMSDLLARALRGRYALGYFEAWDPYSLEAALEAAEETNSPAILGFGGAVVNQPWLDRWGVEELAALARCLGERAAVPTAILFNEARTFAQVLRGLRAGCNAVMLDASHLPYQGNLALTCKVTEAAHALGATVEAELGRLADASPPSEESAAYTDPAEAARFVRQTGVDALAVSVGNVHVLTEGEATPNLELLARIHEMVPVPLVIHGGTGFPSWAVRPAIERGVAKFNIGTRSKQAMLAGIREALAELPERSNVHLAVGSREEGDILARGKAKMQKEILKFIALYGSAGQAAPW
jgi:fructose-bisphosphate aldolase class II